MPVNTSPMPLLARAKTTLASARHDRALFVVATPVTVPTGRGSFVCQFQRRSRAGRAPYGVGSMRAGREKQKLVRLISIRGRFEVPVGANIPCDDYVIPLISRSLYVKQAVPILDL